MGEVGRSGESVGVCSKRVGVEVNKLEDRIEWEGRRGGRQEGKGGAGGTGKHQLGALRVLLRPRLQVRDQGSMFQMDKWLRRQQARLLRVWAARVPRRTRGLSGGGCQRGDGKGGRGGEGMRMRMQGISLVGWVGMCIETNGGEAGQRLLRGEGGR